MDHSHFDPDSIPEEAELPQLCAACLKAAVQHVGRMVRGVSDSPFHQHLRHMEMLAYAKKYPCLHDAE